MKSKLFLIHGWNMPPLIWNLLLEQLREIFDIQVATLPGYERTAKGVANNVEPSADTMDQLLAQAPERSHWCGWSLGATLAMQAAIAAPERISKLTLISPTARFFQDDDWPHGASASVFDRLLRLTKKKYAFGLKHFLQLQLPNDTQADLRNQLTEQIKNHRPSEHALQSGYDTLKNTDLRSRLGEIKVPTQVIAASFDNVISPMASQLCAQQIPNATFQTIGNCHCLPMTRPKELAKLLMKSSVDSQKSFGDSIDREQVARQFSKAAETYDSAAHLQRDLGCSLIDQISPAASGTLVDLGCGTGEALQQIQTRSPALRLIGVDIAPAMIERARTRVPNAKLLVADIEQTDLPAESASVVLSCVAMQWCDPDSAAKEVERLLEPSGQFLMTTFVSGTLPEFREAWRRVRPDLNRVHDLVSKSDWQRALTGAGLDITTLTQFQRIQTFASVDELLAQFRKLGASYAGYDRTPLSRIDYENFRQQLSVLIGDSPKLTYECLTVFAAKRSC
ncbi:alpha/beta fold hydrolase [Mariniblastus sp.]|nr:alpha/beta fold hydrolase [Mariniblastus sp.]